jgi:hypothetical protein
MPESRNIARDVAKTEVYRTSRCQRKKVGEGDAEVTEAVIADLPRWLTPQS